MDQEEKEKIIGKIKKLMALGMKAPETPEAQSAMNKAAEMMDKYSLHTIDMNDDGSIDDRNITRFDIGFEGRSDWEAAILVIIQETFDCKYIWSKNTNSHTLIGSKTDIEFASFLFKFVRLQIKKMGDQYNYNPKDLYTYRLGAAITVVDLIKNTFLKPKAAPVMAATKDLIVVKNAAVERKFREAFPNVRKGKIGEAKGSSTAFRNGRADGEKVKFNRQLGENNPGKLR